MDQNGKLITYAEKYIQEFKDQQEALKAQMTLVDPAREESKTNEVNLNSQEA